MNGTAGNRKGAVSVPQLLKLRQCEQVAAVCFRVRKGEIEFLLVRTRGSGRWTFPKGSAEPGLTHAQAAALEAFEEAGVHGKIQEEAFILYACRKQGGARSARSKANSYSVSAHLCQVSRLGKPKETNRERTWFSGEETKERLREGRKKKDGEEFARVVARAVARIQRGGAEFFGATRLARELRRTDELRRVPFEAAAMPFLHQRQQRGVGVVRRDNGFNQEGPRRLAGEQKLFRVQ